MAKRHSYNQGRPQRAGGRQQGKTQYDQDAFDEYLPPPAKLKKRRRWPKVLIALALVVCLLGGGVFFLLRYIRGDVLDPGLLGTIFQTGPREYSKKDVVHLLIIGIDNEDGRDYGAGLGLTDMILYARYNIKDNQLSLLQIPRDSYVGEDLPTGGTGHINALLISGSDKENPINNLAASIQQQFKLPVDHYVALDMEALRAIVDTFGGLQVYVPREMEYRGSYLAQGWNWLDGAGADFFVRNRHGAGFERADIDRLDNQRHFYSALFRRLLNLTPIDIVNLLPVFDYYCNTDMDFDSDMVALAVAALNLKSENVVFCKAPGATGMDDPGGRGRSLYILDLYGRGTEQDPGLAWILNQYFRDPEKPVPAEELLLPQVRIPDSVPLYPPNIQSMAEVQGPEGGSDVDVEPHA
ncbi:LCP family protein [Ruminococcaceae bacterium OttesenSCG-928-O06]|nr:LCP family protein [Ruminococcaceae bacterium OttesenSCG-928-O06]